MDSPGDYKKVKLPVFFLDETGILNKKDDPFFALGVLRTERPHELQRVIKTLRDRAHYYEEIKWNKMSPLKFDLSKNIITAFLSNQSATFSCHIIRKTEVDFEKHFQNDLTKVYKSFSVILLKNNIDPTGNEVSTVIADDYFYPDGANLELAPRAIVNDHYKKLKLACFLQINSKSSDLLQLTDLLLGAVLYDLKLNEGLIQRYGNLKSQTLDFLLSQLRVKHSFFKDNTGSKRERFLRDKFKVSIFKPRAGSVKRAEAA